MHYNCVWHIKSIYSTKFQVNTVTNNEVIWKTVFRHARVMVIGVSSDLKLPTLQQRRLKTKLSCAGYGTSNQCILTSSSFPFGITDM